MASVGIRELKNRLSEYLRRVAAGERITVTDRGRTVATIVPPATEDIDEGVVKMVREGRAQWGGGKPRGLSRRVKIRGKPLSETILEDRR